jgi:hypothetical protein
MAETRRLPASAKIVSARIGPTTGDLLETL